MGFRLTDELIIRYEIDQLAVIFAILTTVMYLIIGIYQVGYFKHDKNKKSFFVFFILSYLAIMSQVFSATLITMYISFEMITITNTLMVFHERNKAAIKGAFRYLYFSIAGAFTGLAGVFMIYTLAAGSVSFVKGGSLSPEMLSANSGVLLVAAFLIIIGLGVKAAIMPFHAWLAAAHPIAPAPASALLSGIAVNCGIFAVIRAVYYVFGGDFIRGTWVQTTWMILSILTILLGSMLAYKEKIFKKKLAYSTVSQMNYAMFALALINVPALMGAFIHVISHSMVKITLFLIAGILIHKTGKKLVNDYSGLGKIMPITFACYTIAAITLVGIPPAGTFISKWYICLGALNAPFDKGIALAGIVVLMVSALLTAGYLFPIFIDGFAGKNKIEKASESQNLEESQRTGENKHEGGETVQVKTRKWETSPSMLVAIVILTIMIVILGFFPNILISILDKLVISLL